MEAQAFGALLEQLAQLTARQCMQVQARLGQGDTKLHVDGLQDQDKP